MLSAIIKQSRKLPFIFFLLILLFGFAIRIYRVGTAPSAVNVDEASFGYIAHSLAQTGKDEHGIAYPLTFQAFGDQKLPIYAYLLIPIVRIFGINSFSVRLPSVIAGTFLIVLMYLICRELGFAMRYRLFCTLLTAVSPWTVTLSRFGYESNIGLTLFACGLFFIIKAIRKPSNIALVGSGLFFGLTWYSYIAYRMTTVFFIFFLCVFLHVRRIMKARYIIMLLASFCIIIAPLFSTMLSSAGTARFNQVGFLADEGFVMEINENRALCTQHIPKVLCYAIFNKPITFMQTIFNRFISTFSLDYLFTYGEREFRYLSIGHFALLPFFVIPFYLFGYLLFFDAKHFRIPCLAGFIAGGVLSASLPVVLVGEPQRVRLSPLYPFIAIIIVYGFAFLDRFIKKVRRKDLFFFVSMVCLTVFGYVFMLQYLDVHVKKNEAMYGAYIKDLMVFVQKQPLGTYVYIKPFFSEPLMYYAYYTNLNPQMYQKEIVLEKPKKNGFQSAIRFRNIFVTDHSPLYIACKSKLTNQKALYITNEQLASTENTSYIGKTSDGVYTMVFAYESSVLLKSADECEEIIQKEELVSPHL